MLTVIGAIGVLVVAQALVREARRRAAVAREIDSLAREVQRLESQRSQFSQLLERADAPEFLEREARLRLGLQKPGESVLIIRDSGQAAGAPAVLVPTPKSTDASSEPSNIRRWWQHFFR